MSVNGKVVVITGASSGIGAALAELLAGQGAKVVLAARREQQLKEVAARCGGDALPVVADVSRREDVRRVVSAAIARFGRIDVWVNNAGRGISRPPSQLTDEDVQEMMQVNVMAALYGMQEVLPHFTARGDGQFVNVSSMLGRIPFVVERAAYSAAKHYLNSLTTNFRDELRRSHPGIAVTLVSPGVVATDFGLSAKHGGPDSRTMRGAQPVGEAAAVIAEAIETRRADVYTQPQGQRRVAEYYANPDLGEA